MRLSQSDVTLDCLHDRLADISYRNLRHCL